MYAAIRRHKEETFKKKLANNAKNRVNNAYFIRVDEDGTHHYTDDFNDATYVHHIKSHTRKPKSGHPSYSKMIRKVAAKKVRHMTKEAIHNIEDVEDFSDVISNGSNYKKVYEYSWTVFD